MYSGYNTLLKIDTFNTEEQKLFVIKERKEKKKKRAAEIVSCKSHSIFSVMLFITSFSSGIIIQVPSSFMPLLLIHLMTWYKSSIIFAVSVLYSVLHAAEGILVLVF